MILRGRGRSAVADAPSAPPPAQQPSAAAADPRRFRRPGRHRPSFAALAVAAITLVGRCRRRAARQWMATEPWPGDGSDLRPNAAALQFPGWSVDSRLRLNRLHHASPWTSSGVAHARCRRRLDELHRNRCRRLDELHRHLPVRPASRARSCPTPRSTPPSSRCSALDTNSGRFPPNVWLG